MATSPRELSTPRSIGHGLWFGLSLLFGWVRCLAADLAPDLSHLAGKVTFHMIPPDDTTGTILVGALFQARQLLAPFPDQHIKPQEFGLKLRRLLRFAIRCHQSGLLY